MKRKLRVYTNIPTPYQADFFTALSAYVHLTVVYFALSERGRQWVADNRRRPYHVIYLQDTPFARLMHRWVKDYHFSWSIFVTILRDPSDYIMVGGGYWVPNAIVAMLVARWRQKKTAFFGERLAGLSTGWKASLKKALLWPVRYGCIRVFAVGQEAAHTYSALQIHLPKTVVPYTIDIDRFAGDHRMPIATTHLFVFLSVGSLTHRKGMDTLIRAFQTLDRSSYGHVRLRIAGDGPERAVLEQLAGTDCRIEWLGFTDADALPDCFVDSDAFVFASRYDGWGVVINEAIAAGLPIISSHAVGAAREWVQDGINGFLCPPDDIDAFASAMRRLVDEPAVRQQQAAFNQVFRPQTSATHYANVVYQAMLNDLRE